MTLGQIPEPQFSNSRPDKFFHFITKCLEHPPNLSIDPLTQNNPQACRCQRPDSRHLGSLAIEKNSPKQFGCQRRIPRSVQRHLVFLIHFVTRMAQVLGQFAIARKNKQSFRGCVEPSDIEKPRKFCGKKIENYVARVRIAAGRNETGRFMQDDGERGCDMEHATIHLYVVTLPRLGAEIRAALTIYRDVPACDKFVAMTARTDTGRREETIQAQSKMLKVETVTCLKRGAALAPIFNFVTL